MGNTFVSVDCVDKPEESRMIQVFNGFDDWDSLEQQIWELSAQGVILRLVTDIKLPKEIVWAASYSEKNIIQINLDMTQRRIELDWVDKLMSVANRCGVYCVLCLHPIVPGIVRTYHVLEVINRIKGKGHFHVNLKFCEITGHIIEDNGWMNFNGQLLSTKYMSQNQGEWECSQEYKQLFLKKIQLFTTPKRISVSICSENTDCTGLNKK